MFHWDLVELNKHFSSASDVRWISDKWKTLLSRSKKEGQASTSVWSMPSPKGPPSRIPLQILQQERVFPKAMINGLSSEQTTLLRL